MNETNSTVETAVRSAAAAFQYPPTPDLAAGVRRKMVPAAPAWRSPARRAISRPLAFAAATILLLLAAFLAVPPLRATLTHLFRAGAVTINVGPQPELVVEGTPLAGSLADLAVPLTLAEAEAAFRPVLALPTALDRPDEVYLHRGSEYEAVLAFWRDPARPEQIAYALYQIDGSRYASKGASQVEQVNVAGNEGFWLDGPHYFYIDNQTLEPRLFVAGSSLVWWDGPVTYRLEGADTLEEALAIAESLRPLDVP